MKIAALNISEEICFQVTVVLGQYTQNLETYHSESFLLFDKVRMKQESCFSKDYFLCSLYVCLDCCRASYFVVADV